MDKGLRIMLRPRRHHPAGGGGLSNAGDRGQADCLSPGRRAAPTPPADPAAPLIFSEAQFQGRKTFYARWLAAIFLYLYRHHKTRPWRAVVVFPHPQADTGIVTPYEGLFACGLLRRVYLCDLLGREDLGFDARLARLIILEATQAPAEARALVAAPRPAPIPWRFWIWSKPFWSINSPPCPARRSAPCCSYPRWS
jgi:hypothetical protein